MFDYFLNKKKSSDVLSPMGANIINCHKVSAGQIAKMGNNLALGIQMISICEAHIFGKAFNMSPHILNQIIDVLSFFDYKQLILHLI